MSKRGTPNNLLLRMRRQIKEMKEALETELSDPRYTYEELVEVLTALDEAAKAGNLPEEWRPKNDAVCSS
jgi:hypothetical protein